MNEMKPIVTTTYKNTQGFDFLIVVEVIRMSENIERILAGMLSEFKEIIMNYHERTCVIVIDRYKMV